MTWIDESAEAVTYATFLLLFLGIPIGLLLLTRPSLPSTISPKRKRWSLALVCLIAFVYTTLWDNYLVYRGVWGYGHERVLGTIGYVPLEEYAFFLLQPLLTGLFLYRSLHGSVTTEMGRALRVRVLGGVFWLAITGIGAAFLLWHDEALYMGLILVWAGPVLLALWAFAGDLFWTLRRPFLIAVAVPTVYLWIADRIALALGIWHISEAYTFDASLLGLPVEEAAFFLVTNLLVVQGTLLFLFGDVLASREQRPQHPTSPTPTTS